MKLSHGPLCPSGPQNTALSPHSSWSEPRPSLCHSVPRPDPQLPMCVCSLLQTAPSCARRRPLQETSVWNPAGARAEGGQTTDHNILVVSAVGPEMGLGPMRGVVWELNLEPATSETPQGHGSRRCGAPAATAGVRATQVVGTGSSEQQLGVPVLWPWPPRPAEDCLPGCGLCPSVEQGWGAACEHGASGTMARGAGREASAAPSRGPNCQEKFTLRIASLPAAVDLCTRRGGLGPPACGSFDAVTVTLGLVRLPSLPWPPTAHSVAGSGCVVPYTDPSGSFQQVLLCGLRVTGSPDPGARPCQHGGTTPAPPAGPGPSLPSANTSEPELCGSWF